MSGRTTHEFTCDRCGTMGRFVYVDEQLHGSSDEGWFRVQASGATHFIVDALDVLLCPDCMLDLSDFTSNVATSGRLPIGAR